MISQQEARLMVESVTSTSSSSGTTSSFPPGPDSRRESLDPNTGSTSHHQHHLLSPSSACEGTHLASRSSADGEEDSDPCLSYPYLPLDEDVAVGTSLSSASTAHFIRRHSLPLSSVPRASSEESDDVILPSTSAVATSSSGIRRQHSIGARRAVPRQASDSSVPSATSHRRRLSHRRNVFASSRSPIQTVESESPGSSFENDREPSPRVTFHFGPDDEESTAPDRDAASHMQAPGEGEDKENSSSEKVASMRRRGSAPGSLLLSQLGSRSLSVSSRENSPPAVLKVKNLNSSSSSSNLAHRRGSLPVEILPEHLQALGYDTQAQPCRPPSSSSSSSSSSKPGAKRKIRDRRRRSGGFETSHLQQENMQSLVNKPQQQVAPSTSGHHQHRRGSAPMVRLGPSSGSAIKRNVDAFFFGARSPLIPPPSPFMDRPYKQQHEVEEEEEDDEEEEGGHSPPLALMSKRRGSLPTEIINASSTK